MKRRTPTNINIDNEDIKRRTPISFEENVMINNKLKYFNYIFIERLKKNFPFKNLNNLKPPQFNSLLEDIKKKYPINEELINKVFNSVKENNINKFKNICLKYPYLDLNIENNKNETLLMVSIEYDSEQIFDYLITNDIDIDYQSIHNIKTPIVHAIYLNSLKYVKKLIKLNVNLNDKLINGLYPINYAIKYKVYEIIEYLIDNGAHLSVLNKKGINPIIQTILLNDNISFDILIRKKVCIYQKSLTGETPLMYAIKKENTHMQEKLIELSLEIPQIINSNLNEIIERCTSPFIQNYLNKEFKKETTHCETVNNDMWFLDLEEDILNCDVNHENNKDIFYSI